jgi:predicted amidophosphoribosyltransferase
VSTRTFTLEQIEAAIEDQSGFCLACGAEASGIEPDAREYICEVCGLPEVYGAEELILMMRVK